MAAKAVDRRIQRTRKLLQDALTAMMVEKGYEATTIQDIIDRGVIFDVSDRDFIIDDPIDAFTLIVPLGAFPSQSTLSTEQRDGGLVSITISIADPQ